MRSLRFGEMAATRIGVMRRGGLCSPGYAGVYCATGLASWVPAGRLVSGGCRFYGYCFALVFELIDGAVGGGDVGALAEIDGLVDTAALS